MPAGRPGVPWLTALPLAVLVCYADGFWALALRGAVGAVERNQTPFVSWLRESTLALPAYVLAVVVALAVVRRWSPGRRALARTAAATAAVSLAGALVSAVTLTASAVLDYRLQARVLESSSASHGLCTGDCLERQLQVSQQLQLEAVGVGIVLVVLTNVVVSAWVVALRGGRLDLEATRPARVRTVEQTVAALAVAGLVGAAVVHAAVVPVHLGEWPAAGSFFGVLAVAQVAAAVLVRRRLDRPRMLLAVLVAAGPLTLWAVSRTVGVPWGPEAGQAEAVGPADVASGALEVLVLVTVAALARRRWGRSDRGDRRAWSGRPVAPVTRAVGLLAVAAVTAVGLGGSGVPAFDVVVESGAGAHVTHGS